ncbi:MAG: methyltransferase MtaB domain-containing protein [Anaerolineae bacterium]
METYERLAIGQADGLIFGRSPRPLTLRSGLTIGGGTVYPELNFTLPVMPIEDATMPEVRAQYEQMITDACKRAVELNAPGLVVEFELLPELTLVPEWGAQVTSILREGLDEAASAHGLRTGLRVTPNDTREFTRPPLMREGEHWDNMVKSFQLCAKAGADMLSIESTGGKELHDEAIQMANLPAVVFSLGILGCRDMAYLWDMIVSVAQEYDCVASGDTACGFGNTAMMLAEIRYIPRVWAALIRVLTVTRSLVAYERGAVGPSKDCAYEGPYIKAITGYPIALEGAEAACAHLSPVGNITKAYADLWSNESVQNVKLLGGMAPTVSLEQLTYATRIMNVASSQGSASALSLRDLYVESDSHLDPQAFVLRPDVVVQISSEIVQEPTCYRRTRRAALTTLNLLRSAHQNGLYKLPPNEVSWLDRLQRQADQLPEDESEFIAQILPTVDSEKVRLDQYGLNVN